MKVWLVTKNSDFTEGRGPMLPHLIFDNENNAVEYILMKPGIFGSAQGETGSANKSGRRSFNGYAVAPFTINGSINVSAMRTEMAELSAEIAEQTARRDNLLKMVAD